MPSNHRNLYIATIVAWLTAALFGYSIGFVGGIIVLPSFLRQFHLDVLGPHDLASARSTIVAIWMLGAFIGAPLGIPLCSRFGRRACLIFSAFAYVAGAIMQLTSDGNFEFFVAGRLLNGLGVGAGTLVSPMYIAEIAPKTMRGQLMSGYQVILQFCALVGFWGAFIANSAFSADSSLQWQFTVILQLVPGVALMLGTLIIPDSPRYYASIERPDLAEQSLAWLRRLPLDDLTLEQELREVKYEARMAALASSNTSFIQELKKKDVLKRLLLGIGIMLAQNLVGMNALNFYTPVIFQSAGFTRVSTSLLLTGIFGLIKLLSAVAFMLVFVRMRTNRFWLKLGSFICLLSMLGLAGYTHSLPASTSNPRTSPSANSTFDWSSLLPIFFVNLFSIAFTISLGPISWNICSEIFPLRINTLCCAITTATQWIGQIVVALITPRLLAAMGWGMYVFYASWCAVVLVWVWLAVPETRDVGLGKPMDSLFGVVEDADDDEDVVEVGDDIVTPLLGQRGRRASMATYT